MCFFVFATRLFNEVKMKKDMQIKHGKFLRLFFHCRELCSHNLNCEPGMGKVANEKM